ncbi:hypothetical protein [Phenylobacterium aquaticum]|uniref:hypothetical protein n=1 Tax=Phenylobacterium aquaticum TaxID=1763816 RepID=UPI0026E9A7AF|nr:hypothetical protein [Phenylobacterium aquaticum]
MSRQPGDTIALDNLKVAIASLLLSTAIGLASLYVAISGAHPGASFMQKTTAITQIFGGRPENAAATLQITTAAQPPSCAPGAQPATPTVGPGVKPQPPAIIQSATTNGVTASVTGLYVKNDNLYANIRLTNATGQRFYFQDAQVDPAQAFALASGGVLSGSYATQMPICTSDFAGCIDSPSQMAPSHFSYVDPKSTLDIGLYWTIGSYKETAQAGSFSLVLIGRLMASDADTASGPPLQMYRFNFTDIPISR